MIAMNSPYRRVNVFVQDRFAAVLRETEDGYELAYDSAYLDFDHPKAISLTLPLQREVFCSKTIFPFFDGLIPEGWLLDVVVRNWKLNAGDRFGVLMVACRDCIGDVRIEDERE